MGKRVKVTKDGTDFACKEELLSSFEEHGWKRVQPKPKAKPKTAQKEPEEPTEVKED